eukprot:scaffold56181_cov27-Tisochrysis_lutea.AAC.2
MLHLPPSAKRCHQIPGGGGVTARIGIGIALGRAAHSTFNFRARLAPALVVPPGWWSLAV